MLLHSGSTSNVATANTTKGHKGQQGVWTQNHPVKLTLLCGNSCATAVTRSISAVSCVTTISALASIASTVVVIAAVSAPHVTAITAIVIAMPVIAVRTALSEAATPVVVAAAATAVTTPWAGCITVGIIAVTATATTACGTSLAMRGHPISSWIASVTFKIAWRRRNAMAWWRITYVASQIRALVPTTIHTRIPWITSWMRWISATFAGQAHWSTIPVSACTTTSTLYFKLCVPDATN